MILSYPYFLFDLTRAAPVIFPRPPDPANLQILALGQAIILFGAALLCALVGFLYAERLGLPGRGKPASALRWSLLGLPAGIIAAPVAWFLVDQDMVRIIPGYEPSSWPVSLTRMAGGALAREVVLRFGLVTIAVYFLRRFKLSADNWPAAVAISLFAATGTFLQLGRLQCLAEFSDPRLILIVGAAFVENLVLSILYLRRGLLAAVALDAGLNLKLLIYSLLLT